MPPPGSCGRPGCIRWGKESVRWQSCAVPGSARQAHIPPAAPGAWVARLSRRRCHSARCAADCGGGRGAAGGRDPQPRPAAGHRLLRHVVRAPACPAPVQAKGGGAVRRQPEAAAGLGGGALRRWASISGGVRLGVLQRRGPTALQHAGLWQPRAGSAYCQHTLLKGCAPGGWQSLQPMRCTACASCVAGAGRACCLPRSLKR